MYTTIALLMAQIDHYHAVLEKLHTGVVIHAPDTHIVYCNQRAGELLGLSRAQMLGKSAIDPGWHFVDAEGKVLAPEQYPVSRVAADHQPMEETVFGVMVPGQPLMRWLLVSASPEFAPGGRLDQIVVNFHDISALQRSQHTLRANERTYRTLFETVHQGVVYQDRDGHITSANPAAQRILALSLDQLQGRTSTDPAWKSIHEDGTDFPGATHPAMVALRTGQPVQGTVMGISAPGRGLVWITINATPLFEAGEVSGVYAIFEDITEKRSLEEQIRSLAFLDPLTRLPNRHLLDDRIAQALAACQREGHMVALLVLDLDNFKPLNDTHGHMAGDLLLMEVATRLRTAVRAVDTVARFGGDEFVVVLAELSPDPDTAAQQALAVAEKIRQALGKPYLLESPGGSAVPRIEHHCSASIGVALLSQSQDDVPGALRRADQAMYEAKSRGRNRVHLHPLELAQA
jgi:diguanylate cyclase (GGDEF)-like protein/PAS domain S-box-containing protein